MPDPPRRGGAADADQRRRLTDLFDRHGDAIHAYAAHRMPPQDAQDVVSEVFLVAWRRLDEMRAGEERAWLFGVARRVILARARQSADRSALRSRLWAQEPAGTHDFTDGVARRQQVLATLRSLTADDREVLLLAYWYDLDLREAAPAAGCAPATFTVRLYRARRRFARALEAGLTTPAPPRREAPRLLPERSIP